MFLGAKRRSALGAGLAVVASMTFGAAGASISVAGDINNDGRADLVVGIPSESVGAATDAGAVAVLFGSGSGITTSGDQAFDQGSFGGNIEAIDRFGNAIAYGDFNNDNFTDVAIGAPGEDLDGQANAGVVHVLFGSANGLQSTGTQVLSQIGETAGVNESGDFFGADVASGDFNGDGIDDLVVGVPGEDSGSIVASGAIVVMYGSNSGLAAAGSKVISQDGATPGAAEEFDSFGSSVAAGDINGDGLDDIVVGVPGEDVGTHADSGFVHIIFGASGGVKAGGKVYSQNGAVPGISEPGDRFGFDVITGDFNADNFDDVAIGSPGENIGSLSDAGAITILYGSASGTSASNSAAFHANSAGVAGLAEAGDELGFVLAAGDFNGDGDDDLAVGSPGEDIGSLVDAGAVTVFGGGANGLTGPGSYSLSQAGPLVGAPEKGDGFGYSLRAGDFNGDGRDDLAVGLPFEDVGSVIDAGGIVVVYGSGNSLITAGSTFISQASTGVEGSPEPEDRFGSGL